jgi:hypothetical protein
MDRWALALRRLVRVALLVVCVTAAGGEIAEAAPAGGVAGVVRFFDPATGQQVPVAGATVEICAYPAGTPCTIVHTNADGVYFISTLPAGDYTIKVFPVTGMNAHPVVIGPIKVQDGATTDGHNVILQVPLTLPPGTTLTPSHDDGTGTTTIFWGAPSDLTVVGCGGGTGTWRITLGGSTIASGTFTERPSGTYSAQVPALAPNHGAATLEWTIDCPPGVPDNTGSASIYIDPSGFVRTVGGAPIAGATVTLSRSTAAGGPFAIVPNGDAIMAPHNRRNPDTTRADGGFGWDVVSGFYVVRASKPGCVDPADPSKDYVESKVMQIPPAVTDLDLRLACGESVSQDHTITGTVPGALSLTLGPPSSFGAFVPGVAKTYEASTVANVISSYDDTTLTVSDPVRASAGHLVNGAVMLPAPLQLRAGSGQFQALGSSLSLVGWAAPVANETVPIGFRQFIGVNDPLRRGTYSKTLTFTLSTNSP